MAREEFQSPENTIHGEKLSSRISNVETMENLISPRFRSAAAMAGWDEESLMLATMIVEDTPEREFRQRRPFKQQFNSPPACSRRKRKPQQQNTSPMPVGAICLDEEENEEGNGKKITEAVMVEEKKKGGEGSLPTVSVGGVSSTAPVLPCIKDTPERESRHKRPLKHQFKTPPTSSRRKRRTQRRNPSPMPVGAIRLDEEENEGNGKKHTEMAMVEEKKKEGGEGSSPTVGGVSSSTAPVLPCLDRLREELSCAICLEICFEPSTTSCGHSFCKSCLKSAADKCGKRCPKCRQLISNGRSCTVNTVLWNTIQLLFPDEIEARKMAAMNSREAKRRSPKGLKKADNSSRNAAVDSAITGGNNSRRTRWNLTLDEGAALSSRRNSGSWRTREGLTQEGDAALALRLQREEFMEAFGRVHDHVHDHEPRISLYSARSNLRAMASRAMDLRLRGRRPI